MSKRKIYGLNKDGKKRTKKLNGFQRKQQVKNKQTQQDIQNLKNKLRKIL